MYYDDFKGRRLGAIIVQLSGFGLPGVIGTSK